MLLTAGKNSSHNKRCIVIGVSTLVVGCMERLLANNFNIVIVVSDDKFVIEWAIKNRVNYLNSILELQHIIAETSVDFLFSIVNSFVLPDEIISAPKCLAINYHNSPLPRFAGTYATSWALISGQSEYSVSWHLITARLDAGDILKQKSVAIMAGDTAFTLNLRCYESALISFDELLGDIANNTVLRIPQNLAERTFFRKSLRPDNGGCITFSKSAEDISALFRALQFRTHVNELASSKILIGDEYFLVKDLSVLDSQSSSVPGTIVRLNASGVVISTKTNDVCLMKIANIHGEVVEVDKAFYEKGVSLGYAFSDYVDAAFVSAYESICLNEAFWVGRLKEYAPSFLPFSNTRLSSSRNLGIQHEMLKFGLFENNYLYQHYSECMLAPGEFILCCFIMYLSRMQESDPVGVLVEQEGIYRAKFDFCNFFSKAVPFSIVLDPDCLVLSGLREISAQLNEIKNHITFPEDIYDRYFESNFLNVRSDSIVIELSQSNSLSELTVRESKDFPLRLVISRDGNQCAWVYDPQVYESGSLEKIIDHLRRIVEVVNSSPEMRISYIPYISPAESYQLLEWNNTATEYPNDKCIHELFEAQVKQDPNAIAVIFEGQSLTYGELNTKANQLAHYLIEEKHLVPDTLIGICLERSLEMVIAILGVLKAGGAYVPLDPEYPEARLRYMLDDAQLTTVITQQASLARTFITREQALCLDDFFQPFLVNGNINVATIGLKSQHLAYVIYTSGSTGNPKGVMLPHCSIVNRVSWLEQQFPALADDVFCQKTSLGFVDHVAEIFQALAYGRRLVIIRTEDTLQADRFSRMVTQHNITRLTLVPSLLKLFIEQGALATMTSLRLVISSGETLQLREARNFYRALPTTRLMNLYGSSEVGGDASAYLMDVIDNNLQVMQYFLDPIQTDTTVSKKNITEFTHQAPVLFSQNKIFCERYNDSALPQHSIKYDAYVNELNEVILPHAIDVASERFIGHMTSKLPSFIPELSRIIAQLNQNMVKVETSNNLTLIERQVLAIMHRLFYQLPIEFYDANCQDPQHVFGAVTGGGSVANLTALWCARNRMLLHCGARQEDIVRKGAHSLIQQYGFKCAVILGTRLMHYSMRKSAAVMGIGEAGLMYVAQDAQQKMSIDDLERCLTECKNNNIFVIAIVGIAGATETGTVDPLEKIAAVAKQWKVHFHVDAAWGGAFQLSQYYRHRLAGIEQADSITFCPHKQLYLSQGISLCLLRDTKSADTIATYANYQAQKGSYDLGQYSIEGSRPAHALLLHASLHLLGQHGYSWLIEQSMKKTRYFTLMLQKTPCFELIGYPDLNIINYRYIPISLRSKSHYSDQENNYISEIVVKIQQQQFVSGTSFVSKTTIQLAGIHDEPITVFRIVLSNPLTSFNDLHEVLADQLRIANDLVEAPDMHYKNQLSKLSIDDASKYAKWHVPIGKPIANTQLYVFDAGKKTVPCNVYGEIYIGGAGLARGYLNRPELTAEKFIANPFYDASISNSSEYLYKTGDLGRWLPDGNLEFLGRRDHQIKIRGYRVELGEIENVLSSFDIVKEVAVLMRESEHGDKRLVAYVVVQQIDDITNTEVESMNVVDALRQYVREMLPDYMAPSMFVLLDRLPFTPNGKVDRKALPEPDVTHYQEEYFAPETETEIQLAQIWSEVLNIPFERLGRRSNFFHLGGHSLMAVTVASRIANALMLEVSLSELFNQPTLSGLSSLLDKRYFERRLLLNNSKVNIDAYIENAKIINIRNKVSELTKEDVDEGYL
jgi:putative pyridoxal-dependent aspartate 1-decarboxylase